MTRSGENDVAYVEVVNRTLACRDQTGRRPLSQRYPAFPDLSVNAVAIRRLRDMDGLPSTYPCPAVETITSEPLSLLVLFGNAGEQPYRLASII